MANMFKAVTEAMCVVIRGIYSPLVACSVVRLVEYSVCNEVPHLRISRSEVHFHPKGCFSWFELAFLHAPKICQGFLDRAIAVRTFFSLSRFRSSTVALHFFIGALADISIA